MSSVAGAGITELSSMTAQRFWQEILPAARPVVLRGVAREWPVVEAGRESPQALVAYLRRFDRGNPVRAMQGAARMGGRFFYNDDLSGFNYRGEQVKLSGALDMLLASIGDDRPSWLAVQSVPVWNNLPGFERDNPMPLLPHTIEPRVWIGNAVTIAAHHDPSENIAVVAAGRRRFTLFPPEQVANLYPGPFEFTPAGPAISMVDFDAPDLERFPRFPEAMDQALVVDMEPGDALYIPYLWWHHVRSIEPMNMLVNYWWTPEGGGLAQPVEALMHAMLAIKDLAPAHRESWRAMFEHYVFGQKGAPGAHLPPDRRGIQGAISADMAREMRAALSRALTKS